MGSQSHGSPDRTLVKPFWSVKLRWMVTASGIQRNICSLFEVAVLHILQQKLITLPTQVFSYQLFWIWNCMLWWLIYISLAFIIVLKLKLTTVLKKATFYCYKLHICPTPLCCRYEKFRTLAQDILHNVYTSVSNPSVEMTVTFWDLHYFPYESCPWLTLTVLRWVLGDDEPSLCILVRDSLDAGLEGKQYFLWWCTGWWFVEPISSQWLC